MLKEAVEEWMGAVRKIDDYRWELPQNYKEGMNVPGLVFADEEMMRVIGRDQSLEQVANVATLPGIVGRSMAMPDIHWGYGFPIGGVAATRVNDGVVSPGGVGFDINCGVRLLRTELTEVEVRPKLQELVAALYTAVPSGVGVGGKLRLDAKEIDKVLLNGALWAVERGYGLHEDLELLESQGRLPGADPTKVGSKPRQRGAPQLGTLGAGNHFLEVQVVEDVYQPETAQAMGIHGYGQVLVMIHTGSRGLGHQVCEDYLKVMDGAIKRYGIHLPDRQLACAPVSSPEGQDYLAAMACGANFAWANRQCITHWVREAFTQVFQKSPHELGIRTVYDVAHNIAKIEEHVVPSPSSGQVSKRVKLCVHRKGATRAYPAGHPEIPAAYQGIGQPVLIPGDMGRYSFIAVGTEQAMAETFGSTCHGAGRMQSRAAAMRSLKGTDIRGRLEARGIAVQAGSYRGLLEEASEAYKDVAHVVDITEKAGISLKVVKVRPLGVIKG
ncbi:MAG: RtcB family protein [Chloroflexi bacterium]|nr:RtcB family protein [Chloroflexota bacterium]